MELPNMMQLPLMVLLACIMTATTTTDAADAAGPSACRLVALGDVHGDAFNAKRALHKARITDEHGNWVGGCSTLVQTGDLVDRGHGSLEALDYFAELQHQAKEDGGTVVLLLGNHEIMNMMGETSYVSQSELEKVGPEKWRQAFNVRRGKYGTMLASRPVVWNVSGNIFAHAGILPEFAAMGIESVNAAARSNLLAAAAGKSTGGGDDADAGGGLQAVLNNKARNVLGDDGPTWTRRLVTEGRRNHCKGVERSLQLLANAKRMIIGHTINEDGKIHELCSGRLVAIDVGMSRVIYGVAAALEIDTVTGVVTPIYVD